MKSDYQLIIAGAGAAGIGAAVAAQKANIDYIVLEAAHRVGGRGFTEELAPGIAWDVGCHWLHSGSINPLTKVADDLGFAYAFLPELPVAKKECIDALPLGCYNNLALLYDKDPFGPDAPQRIDYSDANDVNLALKLKPCDLPYVYVAVAGRTARWLEKQEPAASQDYLLNALCELFGNDIRGSFTRFRHSARGTDPYVKGAFSASKPGYAHCRQGMGEAVADKIFFAGEATSPRAFCTAHGAYETGIRAVNEILDLYPAGL